MTMTTEIEAGLQSYLNLLHAVTAEYYREHYSNLEAPVFTTMKGRKFVRIVQDGGSAHSFVDMTNGNVLKTASWKAPAKHARGNVLKDGGASAIDTAGFVHYLY